MTAVAEPGSLQAAKGELVTLSHGDERITMQILMVTPALAEQILDNRAPNRPLKDTLVARLALDMENGTFRSLNGETIKFRREDEKLDDGQHRLAAVILSGVTIPFLVAGDVPAEYSGTVDTGTARKYSDTLAIRGMRNSTAMSAVIGRLYRWDILGQRLVGDTKGGNREFTFSQMNQYYADNQGEIDDAFARWGHSITGKRLLTPSLLVLAGILLQRVDEGDADVFMHQLTTGEGLDNIYDPVLLLRARLAQPNNVLTQSDVHSRVGAGNLRLALTFLAWNNRRQGKQVTKLQLPKVALTERYPDPR